MCKFLDCVTWVQLNQIEQRSREKKMFPRRARKYLTMIENMLTVGVCWITCTQKVWAETKSIKSPRQCQLPAGGTGEQKGGQNLRMRWIWTLDMSRPAPRGRPRPWPACSAAARSPQSSAGSTVAWVAGYSSFFVRRGGDKEFLVILRENKGILKAREQNFHKKTTVLDQFLSLLCQYFLKITHFWQITIKHPDCQRTLCGP